MANQDPIFLAIKWSLLIINIISAVYIIVIFLEYLFNNNRHGFSVPFMFNCVVGFLISFLGAYAGEQGKLRADRDRHPDRGKVEETETKAIAFVHHSVLCCPVTRKLIAFT